MKMFFHMLMMLSFLLGTAAYAEQRPCELCKLYEHAQPRKPHPTIHPIVCVNFVLPSAPANVTVVTSKDGRTIIKDAKTIQTTIGQFCYRKDYWDKPDTVFLCSQHSVTLHDGQIPQILSGRGNESVALACLLGIKGCGGRDAVAIPWPRLVLPRTEIAGP